MLYLVRHGQTAPNVAGVFLGRADPPLTELGAGQALQLAAALPTPDLLVASPLRRARDTAAAFGVPVQVDERWIELDYGDLEGLAPASIPDDVRSRWRSDAAFIPGGGESLAELGSRVREACRELAPEAAARNVVVVTHVSPIKAAIAWALGVSDLVAWRLWVEEAGVARVAFDAGEPVLRSFNEHARPAP